MAISLTVPKTLELKPRIIVFGVGGAGGNAVNNMIEADLQGVEFVVANTDAQALHFSKTECIIQLGSAIMGGLGAGANPEKGAQAAEDSLDEICAQLEGAHMVFITAGMGGGTGTGAAPVIARAARELGILTVGVVTKPFRFEGEPRMEIAELGVEKLQSVVDTLIVIPNQNLFRVTNEKTTMTEAFAMADKVLYSGVRGLTSLMVEPGLMNLDFADVRTVMNEMGAALMGTGEASGEDRAINAARAAIANPLLDDIDIRSAQGVLINVTGGDDLTLHELEEAAELVRGEVGAHAKIIVGSAFDTSLNGAMRVSVVATGIDVGKDKKTRHDEIMANPPFVQTGPALDINAEEPLSSPAMPAIEPQTSASAGEDEMSAQASIDEYQEHELAQSQDVNESAPVPHAEKPAPRSRYGRFSFGFLGARRKPSGPPPAMIADEQPKMPHRAEPCRETPDPEEKVSGDLFDGHIDEALEIPAFLRRQAN